MLLLAIALLASGPQESEEAAALLAVTRSGMRVECVRGTAVGDVRVQTPYGVLRTPTDPVQEVVDGSALRARLVALAGDPAHFDWWLRSARASGLLTDLVAGCEQALARDPGRLDVYQVLEDFGARLDPVPERVKLDARLDWLWGRTRAATTPAAATLLAARLVAESSPAPLDGDERNLSVAELRRGLREPAPHLRRAAARVAARQGRLELIEELLELSITDPQHAVREAAAWGAARAHANEARAYWTLVLARAPSAWRQRAADALGRHGGEAALEPLILALSAHDQEAGHRYRLAQVQLMVVQDVDHTLPLGRVGHSAFDTELPELRTTFKVSRLEPADTTAILTALEQWAGPDSARRSPAEWLRWYLENQKPPRD